MKKIIGSTVLILMLMCLLCFGVSAADAVDSGECGAVGDNVAWELYDDGTLIISGEGAIDENAFENNTIIRSVIISEGITKIGYRAFQHCNNLSSIMLPDSIKSIGKDAFWGTAYYENKDNWEQKEGFCDGILYIGNCLITTITSIEVSDEQNTAEEMVVKDGTVVIADSAMWGECSFKKIVLPDSVAYIGKEAFYECYYLESIRIPKSVTFIDDYTFGSCERLTDVYYGGSEKEWIDTTIYEYGNETLFDAIIHFEGGNLILTDEDIYAGETKTVYVLPEQITYLRFIPEVTGNYSFSSSGDDSVVHLFDESKNEITDYEYGLICELEAGATYYWGVSSSWNDERGKCEVTLEKACDHENTRTVEAVDPTCTQEGYTEGIFCDDCEQWLEGHEWISGGHIDENSDKMCERCGEPAIRSEGSCGGNNITYDEESDEWYSDGTARYTIYMDGTLEIYGEGHILEWSFGDYWNWSVKEVIIYDGITGIGNYSFRRCENLTKVTVPASVESIGVDAFYGCENLKEISIYNPDCVIADDSDVIPDHTVICGEEGSTAEEYAEKYGKEFYVFCEHKNVGRVEAVAPTCTTAGYTEGEKCFDCGRPFSGCEKIAAKHTNEDADSVCDVCNTELISDILPGETKSIEIISGEITRLKFIPSKTGMYTFCSLSDDDTYGYLYDENGVEITKNDDGENGSNFSISYKLEAGVTYYWGARYYSGQDGSFDVSLTYEETVCSHENATAYEGAEATCTQDGYEAGIYCDDCQEWIEGHGVIEALGHDEISHEAKAPTCTENGWDEYVTCSRCDYSTYEEKSSTGHSHTPSVTAPTCTEGGYTTYTCPCGDSYTETLGVAAHKVVTDKAISATCTKTGLTEGSHCSVCNTVIKKQTTIPKKSHLFDKGTVTKAASYKASGVKTYKCTACKTVIKTEIVKRLSLAKVNGLKATPATSSIKISWSKVTGAEKYEVYYSANGKKWTKITSSKNNVTIKKLKKTTSYKVKVRAVAGANTGSYSSILSATTVPGKVTMTDLRSKKSKILTPVWKTVSGATGYEVTYSTSKKFTKKTTKTVTIKKSKTTKITIKKLKKGKKYYVKVRAYKTVSGKKIYGAYSSVKSIKVK